MRVVTTVSMSKEAKDQLEKISKDRGFSQSAILEILIGAEYHEPKIPRDLSEPSLATRFTRAVREKYRQTMSGWADNNGVSLGNLQRILRRMENGETVGTRPNTDTWFIRGRIESILLEVDGYI